MDHLVRSPLRQLPNEAGEGVVLKLIKPVARGSYFHNPTSAELGSQFVVLCYVVCLDRC